jgi:hypothetical protein
MKLYKTREKILGPLGNDRYEMLYEKGEIVMLIEDGGPFAYVKRPGIEEKPRMLSWSKLEEQK